MKKRLFIIHGWSGSPNEPLISWLGKQAIKAGFETSVLEMPNTDTPVIDEWVDFLATKVGALDENTYFITHSMGCPTLFRYLQKHPGQKIGGAVLIAPWIVLTGIDVEADKAIIKPWLETPIDFEAVRTAGNNFTAIFSDDDPFVPMEQNIKLFKDKLNPKIITEHGKGHFNEDAGVTESPIVFQAFLDVTKE